MANKILELQAIQRLVMIAVQVYGNLRRDLRQIGSGRQIPCNIMINFPILIIIILRATDLSRRELSSYGAPKVCSGFKYPTIA